MLGLRRQRVVEVYSALGEREQVGSGYLIGQRHLLTAAHVVGWEGRPAEQILVRCLDQKPWAEAKQVWWRPEDEVDLALLEVTQADWQPPQVAPPRWGRIEGAEKVA